MKIIEKLWYMQYLDFKIRYEVVRAPSPWKLDYLKSKRAVFTRKTTKEVQKREEDEGQQNPLVWTKVFDSPFWPKTLKRPNFACKRKRAAAKSRGLAQKIEHCSIGANWCDLMRTVLRSTARHGAAWCEVVRRVCCKHARVYCKPGLRLWCWHADRVRRSMPAPAHLPVYRCTVKQWRAIRAYTVQSERCFA